MAPPAVRRLLCTHPQSRLFTTSALVQCMQEILPVFAFNWSWMRPSQHRVGPMATRKELLALALEADDVTAAANGTEAHMAELKV